MTKHESTHNNKELVLRALNEHGGRTTAEICQKTQLTRHQVRTALHDLKQSAKVYLEGNGSWYPTASKLEPYLIHRLWDKNLFAGLAKTINA